MNVEKTKQIMKDLQVQEARAYFETFGRIERVFVNGFEIKPWHVDAMLVEIVREQTRIQGLAIVRINGVCALRVSMRPMARTRRSA